MPRHMTLLLLCCLPFASLAQASTSSSSSSSSPAAVKTAPAPSVDARTAVDGIAGVIAQYYHDAAQGARIAGELRADAARGAFDGSAPQVLATRLTDRLDPIDRHFKVRWAPADAGRDDRAPDLAPEDAARRDNHGIRRVEVLPGNVGYLDLRQFAAFNPEAAQAPARASIDAALNVLAHVDALIIDLRDNGGGSPAMVGYLASAFTPAGANIYNTFRLRERTISEAPPVPYAAPRLSMPLYVLTSARTGSAAESFAYTLGNAGRAVVVGTPTAGAANPGGEVDAGHGFRVFVSTGTPISPITGRNWEGVGVQPHVGTDAAQALATAHILALEAVLASGLPAAEAVDTRWALEALRAEAGPLRAVAWQDYLGDYGTVGIDQAEGRLRVRRGERPPLLLLPISDDLFAVVGNPAQRVRFQRDGRGRVTALELLRSNGALDLHPREDAADNSGTGRLP